MRSCCSVGIRSQQPDFGPILVEPTIRSLTKRVRARSGNQTRRTSSRYASRFAWPEGNERGFPTDRKVAGRKPTHTARSATPFPPPVAHVGAQRSGLRSYKCGARRRANSERPRWLLLPFATCLHSRGHVLGLQSANECIPRIIICVHCIAEVLSLKAPLFRRYSRAHGGRFPRAHPSRSESTDRWPGDVLGWMGAGGAIDPWRRCRACALPGDHGWGDMVLRRRGFPCRCSLAGKQSLSGTSGRL